MLAEVYRSLWVVGEVQRARATQRGHLYFELVEKGQGDTVVGKIDAVLWRTDHTRVARVLRGEGQQIEAGQQIRCRGQIDYYPPAGRLQLVVREVDPLFALGLLERRRRETLAQLEAAGLLERNRALSLPALPLSLLLITSAGSAAYHDFLAGLAASGYGFRVQVASCAVQGANAEPELSRALGVPASATDGTPGFDAVVMVRGGGSRSDLAAFDSRDVAEAVARCPLPVLTGLGHEIDHSVADVAAHQAFKTPSEVATFLVDRVARGETTVAELGSQLVYTAGTRLESARRALGQAHATARLAQNQVRAASERLESCARRCQQAASRRIATSRSGIASTTRQVALSASRALARQSQLAPRTAERINERARARLALASAVIDGHQRLFAELSPARILARGFSITRQADGSLLCHAAAATVGVELATEVADGVVRSRVMPAGAPGPPVPRRASSANESPARENPCEGARSRLAKEESGR